MAAPTQTAPAQLIVKFKPSSGLTCDSAGIARLSAQAGFRFDYLRPMSGDACVLTLRAGARLPAAITALQALPGVEWAEPDAVMRAN
jgi:hypothetical protein